MFYFISIFTKTESEPTHHAHDMLPVSPFSVIGIAAVLARHFLHNAPGHEFV